MKSIKFFLTQLFLTFPWRILVGVYLVAVIGGLSWSWWESVATKKILVAEVQESGKIVGELSSIAEQYEKLKNSDQVKLNEKLSQEIAQIESTFADGAELFERRADLGSVNRKLDIELAKFLAFLGEREWEKARELIKNINSMIDKIVTESAPKISAPAAISNTLPGSGYSRQRVSTSRGEFVVAMVVAPGARAVIETMDDPNCVGNCEARPLAEHIAKSGGFAGINGSYFCPPDYAQCQGKTNSFDTLAVNGRNKLVFNRDNNVYSTIPLVAAYNTSLSFYDQTVQWGVDTSGGGAIANFPRLLRDGVEATSEENGKGTRGFVGVKDGVIVIGHVFAASFADAASTLRALGLQNALNLDGGGSSALWYEGAYKVGPGRALPTAIVLVR